MNLYILLKNKLIKETLWGFATKGVSFVLLMALNIFLARILGVEDFGLWSFLFRDYFRYILIQCLGLMLPENLSHSITAQTN